MTHHAVNDFWTHPYLMVEVQLQNPEILDAIALADNRIFELKSESNKVQDKITPLREKKKRSEIKPRKKLSHSQVQRLEYLIKEEEVICENLDRSECSACDQYEESDPCPQCAKCNELNYLQQRKTDSEITPGEPLSEVESYTLVVLKEEQSELRREIQRLSSERVSRYESITGRTTSVETDLTQATFGYQHILNVHSGDKVKISVLDDDVGKDDLYGSTVIRLSQDMLDAGDIQVRMPNVKHVTLRFQLIDQDD